MFATMLGTAAVLLAACGFLNPNNEPHPIWGIWTGGYPTTLASGSPAVEPDTARWVFTSWGAYELFVLDENGTLVPGGHEVGYYTASGLLLTFSADRDGLIDSEEFIFRVVNDVLTIDFRGEEFSFRRIGDHEAADRFEDVLSRNTSSDSILARWGS